MTIEERLAKLEEDIRRLKRGEHACDGCGEFKDDVHECMDPYDAEIRGEDVKRFLCGYCYHERAMDV